MHITPDEKALYLFNEGNTAYAYKTLGAHALKTGFRFSVFAPHAKSVSVVGSFNDWDPERDPMEPLGSSGVYSAVVETAKKGDVYKFSILCPNGQRILKADPFAFYSEYRPGTNSILYGLSDYSWGDEAHMEWRKGRDALHAPMNIYEVHPGSWKAGLGYREMAEELVFYAADMGFSHLELMPLSEYPLDDSWGYQVSGYYSITSRYGKPEDLKYLVDRAHQAGLSVILDWVPAHFTKDDHGLRRFDGEALFENPDPRRSEQPQWGTLLFDYGRTEVQSFLISNAVYFLKEFHIDALRVDAVSCMLYLDYGKEGGEWIPNLHGGRENLEAIAFLKKLSDTVRRECPGCLLIAEESTAFPYITKKPEEGGLGFDLKWNMGWMNDTLSYMSTDSLYRVYHHNKLTFSMCYAFSEQHVLPFSHDEVVHLKRSLLGRMPGSYEEQFRQLRLLYMYQYAHPGKKLLFMGGEFGQFAEWDFHKSLDWFLLDYPAHRELQRFVRELNHFYKKTPALYEVDDSWEGFQWLSVDDAKNSVLVFLRRDKGGSKLLCAFNFAGLDQAAYSLKLPGKMGLKRLMSSVDLEELPCLESRENEAGEEEISLRLYAYEAAYYLVEDR